MTRVKSLSAAAVAALLSLSVPAMADPPQITDDEGYSRLAQWESHLDQRITEGVRERWLRPDRAWRIQKDLDNVELQVLQAYYVSDNGIDTWTFRRFAGQLRQIGSQLNDFGWSEPQFDEYGYGPPQAYGPGYGPQQTQPGYYQQGYYETACRRGNAVAGTIFGALGGGLIGGAVSHGNGAAVAGGVLLGGVLGNALSQDIDCDDHQYAFPMYQQSFAGDLNREYEWRHGDNYGTVVSTREYYRGGYVCRDFHAVNYRGGRRTDRDGTACRQADGYWHFD